MSPLNDPEFAASRSTYTKAILDSKAHKKLIVAGPGTGKTYTFTEVFKQRPGKNLALTFLKSLVVDLEDKLGKLSDVHSFHGFCKELLHKYQPEGIDKNFHYYPPLLTLIAEDITLSRKQTTSKAIEADLLNLVEDSHILKDTINRSNYYNAIGYTDSVYRILKLLKAKRVLIPPYDQIVVDEFQDFSELEVSLIQLLAEVSPILIAGDDDQALYGFKHASAKHIRDLANGEEYERFELPYCTRCTDVIVSATQLLLGLHPVQTILAGRLGKQYICYLPDKRDDSTKYPTIIHADCSVEQTNAPYMSRYIHEKILAISKEEIQESYKGNYPTALIIAPKHIATRLNKYLKQYFKNVEYKETAEIAVDPLFGYKLLLKDPNSRLGWRIIAHIFPPTSYEKAIKEMVASDTELSELLPDKYKELHLRNAGIIGKVIADEALSTQETLHIERSINIPFLELKDRLLHELPDPDEEVLTEKAEESEEAPKDTREPLIMITTMVGSKGLQAGHVFIAGVNEGSFPHKNASPNSDEVCQLLVALTRTKKCCYLISTKRFAGKPTGKSVFIDWLQPVIDKQTIDKTYFAK
jgi:hypothetical protein